MIEINALDILKKKTNNFIPKLVVFFFFLLIFGSYFANLKTMSLLKWLKTYFF